MSGMIHLLSSRLVSFSNNNNNARVQIIIAVTKYRAG